MNREGGGSCQSEKIRLGANAGSRNPKPTDHRARRLRASGGNRIADRVRYLMTFIAFAQMFVAFNFHHYE